jgi:hypothetical protein
MSRISKELGAIAMPGKAEVLFVLAVMVVMSWMAYSLDQARIAAFGLFPAIAINMLASQSGMSFKKTPVLTVLVWTLSAAIYVGATAWVAMYPR